MDLTITLSIIIITGIISFTAFTNQKLMDSLIFYPPAITNQKQWYRFFTNGLLHADMAHLFFNIFALYLFGTKVEYYFQHIFGEKGKILYLLMYVLALAVCLLPTYSKHKDDYYYKSLGASGAVSAVIFASIILDPLMGIGLMFIPIYIAGFIFGFIYLAVSSWLDKRGQGNINHSAHIFGALFGIGFLIIAARLFSSTPVLEHFIDQVTNISPSDLIHFGR